MPKILVADDSIAVRKVAERLLVGAGLEVVLAANGEEALTWLANERPDLIVCDVIMPDKTGYDVCLFVRSHAILSETPVLLISGIVNEEVTRQAGSCRADGLLKKPFQGTSLQDCVLELLAKRRTQPANHEAASPAATQAATSPKVYRITEEQLQAFRHATTRIKELEALAAQERAKSAELAGPLPVPGRADERVAELEGLLAQERERSAFLLQRVQEMERAALRADEQLEAATRTLAEIARLAARPMKAEPSVSHE